MHYITTGRARSKYAIARAENGKERREYLYGYSALCERPPETGGARFFDLRHYINCVPPVLVQLKTLSAGKFEEGVVRRFQVRPRKM
jgi:hypothetical protein